MPQVAPTHVSMATVQTITELKIHAVIGVDAAAAVDVGASVSVCLCVRSLCGCSCFYLYCAYIRCSDGLPVAMCTCNNMVRYICACEHRLSMIAHLWNAQGVMG